MSAIALSTASDDALAAMLAARGAPAFRLAQLRRATWQPFVGGLGEIRQLPAGLTAALGQELLFSTVEVAAESEADQGLTVKLLCRLADGQTIETVAMETPARGEARRRSTVCVSTQVGCAVGCPFCATGRMGLRRSCTPAEVVDQVRAAASALHRRRLGPVTHVVYMGMGEPLAAYATTVASLRVLTGPAGISARRITVSTSGVVPAIHRLADEGIGCTLAISLHAATDELRDRLVPLNRVHPLASLVDAGTRYAARTGRRLSLEWCLIGGVNDSPEQARALAELARRARAHINVIPMNHIEDSPWGPPDRRTEVAFLGGLDGVTVTVRDTRGADTDAACGQLRAALEQRRMLRPDGTLSPPRAVAAV
ncbi:MAG: 23S rRNA (adenine(2503)-C(2))-methyltransferase RlmN [Candidatus Dormibacteraeota bacterium]|uniref:23S rRNA (Adenine(2503)-C(2))-methyltransferase RlmN n=1 Tax=Candidatus Amunia macphersoniae TaxID=3127014 RepID=A0A934KKT1_9BACT|nr:23S rRNA (adenine(2503)-C(2))-methyltransferase RlmN [Candidatus Dormibacteraeota bacterium]